MKNDPIVIQLIHIQGPLKGQIQEFGGQVVTIGRNPGCDVHFPKDLTGISRSHAEIVREGNRFLLVDKSTNGTFVNGKQVSEAFLKDGDVIMFSPEGPKVSFLSQAGEPAGVVPAGPGPEIPADIPARAHTNTPSDTPAGAPLDTPSVGTPTGNAPAAPVREAGTPEPQRQAPPQAPAAREQVEIKKVQAPLIVQYGPTLNSFKELPVNVGQGPGNDLILPHPAITDRHAQIFFAQGKYWVKDLTGTRSIHINGRAIDLQAPLNTDDVLSFSPQGPVLRFLGEGRLAEYEEPAPADPGFVQSVSEEPGSPSGEKKSKPFSIKDIFKR